MDDLMTNYDVIVVGTGMTESILAAALSRIGKSVLHMDSNEYYGENWASFNFEGIQNWINKMSNLSENECGKIENFGELKENEKMHTVKLKPNICNVKEKWNCKAVDEETISGDMPPSCVGDQSTKVEENVTDKKETEFKFTWEYMKKESRKFNLDLCPKVLFSRGSLVELLISSNIAKYAEFKSMSRVLTWRNECLELVPCSRADVFSTKNITVVEKRLLVKILTLFLKYPEDAEELSGFENKTFIEYLKYKKLPSNIIHYILYAMAMGDNNTPCIEGVKASKSFLESLGRYGNTPFIFPMYGSGELPQCFCRLCAVFGGVYYLKRGIDGIITDERNCVGIVSDYKRLSAETYIFSENYVPDGLKIEKNTLRISRGIFITDRSILKSEKEPLTLLIFPPVADISDKSVTVIELGPGTSTCPENVFVVHMTTMTTTDAESDLKHVVDALFQSDGLDAEKPKILWSLTWNVNEDVSVENDLENVKICSGTNVELDFQFCIDEARRIFKEICPEEDFLPRAPDPDEIVLPTEELGGGENEEREKEEPPEKEMSPGETVPENTTSPTA